MRPMAELGPVIRQIRARLGLTTRQFAECLGVRHTAVSRWERNQMQPGFLALRELLKLAEGTEKNPLSHRLARLLERSGLAEEAAVIQLGKAGGLVDLQARGWHLVWEEPTPGACPSGPNLAEFSETAAAIIHRGEEIDHSLVLILKLWRDHNTTDDAVRTYFADAATFLEVSLANWRAKRTEGRSEYPKDKS